MEAPRLCAVRADMLPFVRVESVPAVIEDVWRVEKVAVFPVRVDPARFAVEMTVVERYVVER